MTPTDLSYVSMDPLSEGVASSQVIPYVEALGQRGLHVELHSFERSPDAHGLRDRLRAAGVSWHPHPWGRFGPAGGVSRLARSVRHLSGARLVHARGDLAAAAASATRDRPWIWDLRAFFREQRIEQGALRAGGVEDHLLRRLERRLARRADGIVVLASSALPVLARRHGDEVRSRCKVITTCVDLDRFQPSAAPATTTRLGLVGTMNRLYDVPAMIDLCHRVRALRDIDLVAAVPRPSPWDAQIDEAATSRESRPPAAMPSFLASVHAGLSMLRCDLGESTTAAMPTKLAELLASGRPVVVSAGVGDMDDVVRRYGCGVVVKDDSAAALNAAALTLHELLDDPQLVDRCRAAAESHFDLRRGVDALVALYERVSV